MEEISSGLGYNYKCSDDDGGSVGIAARTEGGGGTRAMMFVSAVAVAAGVGDGVRDNRDESGHDYSAVQQSMPPQHHQLPPSRPMIPNPFQNVFSQQQQLPPIPVPSAAMPNLILSPALDPKEEIGVKGNCTNPIEKARAIAMRFQKETLEKQQHPSNYAAINDTSIPNNIDYALLRHQYFQQERNKLQMFTLKNLEYIMKHEEDELRSHVTIMNEMVAYEEQQDLQLQLRQEQQKQYQLTQRHKQEQREIIGIMNEGSGGIGSVEQRRAERARRKRHQSSSASDGRSHHGSNADASSSLQHQHQPSDNINKLRTSLYLTNLPTDGSTSERTLRSLFCSYGRLDRVTMYRHRDSGMLKGDGLIVFGRDAVEEYHQQAGKDMEDGNNNSSNDHVVADLVETVCAQVRTHIIRQSV